MNKVTLYVDGQPIPFKRAGRNGKSTYTPPDMAVWEKKVKGVATDFMDGEPPLEGDISVFLSFYREDNVRADIDNLAKCVMDALNKVAYRDDKQVTQLNAEVNYPPKGKKQKPGVYIQIAPKGVQQ